MVSGGASLRLPQEMTEVGCPSQMEPGGLGASRLSLPQVIVLDGGPRSMMFGGASPRFSLLHPMDVDGGPSWMSSAGLSIPKV